MNPYDTLGVASNASDEDIAKAYKSLAKKYHPDLNPGDEAAARRMGEINRAYDDIKAMRQRGESYRAADGYQRTQTDYGNPFDPFASARRTYTYTYQRPRHSPIGVILAVMVMSLFVRLLLSILFGGYGGSYYVNTRNMPRQGTVVPGYGYYDSVEP
jgi:curved DNA-binding protein CbpA